MLEIYESELLIPINGGVKVLSKQEITDDECKAVVSGYGIFRAL